MKLLNEKVLCDNIESIAQHDLSQAKISGSGYYVFQEDRLTLERCFGSIRSDSLFRLASMTKPVTALAALILADRGLLSLDDPVEQYLPEFRHIRIIDDAGTDLGAPRCSPTVRMLLSHTSGIGSSLVKMERMTSGDKKTLDASVSFFCRAGLDFEPATSPLYSPTGAFDVLTKIMQTVTRRDYLQFLKEDIFIPCHMPDTTFLPDGDQQARLVPMHDRVEGKNGVCKMHEGCIFGDFPWTHYVGGAGLVSTLHDYSNFAKMLLNRGEFRGRRLLREETFDLLRTPQVSEQVMPGCQKWGLGVRIITHDSYPFLPVGSYGWSGAYGSHFWVDPQNRIVGVFMKNSMVDGGAGNESANKFEEAVYACVEQ